MKGQEGHVLSAKVEFIAPVSLCLTASSAVPSLLPPVPCPPVPCPSSLPPLLIFWQFFDRGDHCMQMPSEAIPRLSSEGHPLLCRLAASPCQRRSKTQLLTNVEYSPGQYRLDHAGLGGQCTVPSTVNLGLTLHTGWSCQLTSDVMVKTQTQSSMTSLLSKQSANRANLSVHAKIIYFNTFSLSLFYYSQTHRFFSPALIKPLYQAMADFLLKRHWFPQHLLVGLSLVTYRPSA